MRKKRGESGFALLLVFLMAAAIAITLYMQIPRVAFQAQRQKEQLLIERGGQYKRAIQLFFRTNHRYPAEIKDLENFNNRRFLRHKFIDPITGKDEWRLVHINNGVLTDSLVNKNKAGDPKQQAQSTAGTYVGEQTPIGGVQNPAQQTQNLAVTRRRATEGGAVQPGIGPDGQQIAPGQPITGYPPGQPITGFAPIPGQPIPAQPLPGQAQSFPGQVPGQMGGQPFPAAQPVAGQAPGQPYPGTNVVPGQIPGQPVPGMPNFPGQVQAQPFRGDEASPGAQPFPVNPALPGQVPGQPFAGAPGNPNMTGNPNIPGVNQPGIPGQVMPGRLPGFTPPGAQPNPSQAPTSTPYVGGNQPYVGGSQPYVGGGSYVGTSTSTPGVPTPAPFSPGQVNSAPGQFNPVPGQFGATPGQVNPQPIPNQAPFPGTPLGTPAGPGSNSNPGTELMKGLLGGPRPAPGGLQPGGQQPIGQQIGGGIAGVASKSEDAAIMVYNDRTNYNEWEFVFDYTKDQRLPNMNNGNIGTPAANLGSLRGTTNPVGTPVGSSPFGASPGTMLGGTPGTALGGTPGVTPGATATGSNTTGRPGQAAGANQLPPELRPGRP